MSRKTFTLAITCALWRRPEISAVVLAHYAATDIPGAELKLYAVGSEPGDEKLAEEHGWHYTNFSNDHLGRKRNAGLVAIKGDKPDAVLRIGSDDLLSAALIQKLVSAIKTGHGAAWLQGFHMLDKQSSDLVYLPHVRYMACISSSTLDAMNWAPYDEEGPADRTLSARVSIRAGRVATVKAGPDAPYLSVKTGDEINSAQGYTLAGMPVPADPALIQAHFANAAGYLTGKKATTLAKPQTLKKTKSK